MSDPQELPRELVAQLGSVRSVAVITGAGVSVESGIRTYRGAGGLYDDPEQGDRTIEALTGPTLAVDPDLTWRVVAELARQAHAARPNAAHYAIAAIERKVERFVLLTQNVDGLHQLAGSRNVIDIHGNVFATVCMECQATGRIERGALPGLDAAPRCNECGGVLRPDAVLFGEMLPTDKVARMQDELMQQLPDLVIVVGTTAIFPYISAPVLLARDRGRLTVEVNPERTELSAVVDHALHEPAGGVLPRIEAALADRVPSDTGRGDQRQR